MDKMAHRRDWMVAEFMILASEACPGAAPLPRCGFASPSRVRITNYKPDQRWLWPQSKIKTTYAMVNAQFDCLFIIVPLLPNACFTNSSSLRIAPPAAAYLTTMPTLETHNGYPLWLYIPSRPAAIIFVMLFAGTTVYHIFLLLRNRLWFCIPFVIGGICKFSPNTGRYKTG